MSAWKKAVVAGVGWTQAAGGTAFLAAPDRFLSEMGVSIPEGSEWARWFGWIYGVRGLAWGGGLLWAATDLERRRSWVAAEAAIQAGDAVLTTIAYRKGWLPKKWALPVMIGAAVEAAALLAVLVLPERESEATVAELRPELRSAG